MHIPSDLLMKGNLQAILLLPLNPYGNPNESFPKRKDCLMNRGEYLNQTVARMHHWLFFVINSLRRDHEPIP